MSIKRMGVVVIIGFVLIVAACSSNGGQGSSAAGAGATADTSGGQQAVTPSDAQGGSGGAGGGQGNGQNGGPGFNPANFAAGQVQQISGNTITLTTNNGSLTLNASDQTRVQKLDQGSLSDIQTGQRVTVRGTRAQDGTFTAQMIQIGGQFGGGGRGGYPQGTPRPRQGTPGAGMGGGRGFNSNNMAAGQVQQISGNAIQLTTANGPLTVNMSDQTRIQKMDQGSLSDIQAGQRITAQGTLQADGTFTAQMIQIGGQPMGGNRQPAPTPTSSS